jgi:hypothetical protein
LFQGSFTIDDNDVTSFDMFGIAKVEVFSAISPGKENVPLDLKVTIDLDFPEELPGIGICNSAGAKATEGDNRRRGVSAGVAKNTGPDIAGAEHSGFGALAAYGRLLQAGISVEASNACILVGLAKDAGAASFAAAKNTWTYALRVDRKTADASRPGEGIRFAMYAIALLAGASDALVFAVTDADNASAGIGFAPDSVAVNIDNADDPAP